MKSRRCVLWAAAFFTLGAGRAWAQGAASGAASDFLPHPAAQALTQFFGEPVAADFHQTGFTKAQYLRLIAGNVDHFKQYQRADGAIIDPERHAETQYATPAFAVAAGLLVRESNRPDLLEPAVRALSCSLTALLARKAADNHSDFYIPLIMHAFRFLHEAAPADTRATWETQLRAIDVEKTYRADMRGMNWNIVSDVGEFLRRKDGFVQPDQQDAQLAYLERCLQGHTQHFTRLGMYEDPNAPLAYDAFARLWLEDVMADGAYDGKLAQPLRDFLRLGGLSTLLLLSPAGEWASGGRSAFHSWNEAAIAAICEMQATQWKKAGRMEVAGAFKRAAHISLQSLMRWQKPTGDLWIVKNRAPIAQRLGFEAYSYTSQYNLLPMAMLAIAYARADDAIQERPMPSETGGYVFDLRDTFHKIVAAAGGYYVEVDTAADPHYNATGLQRIHTAGVPFPLLSDSTASERAYGPTEGPKLAMTPGLRWKSEVSGEWRWLADFSAPGNGRPLTVKGASLKIEQAAAEKTSFEVDYLLAGPGEEGRHVLEHYTLTEAGIDYTTALNGGAAVAAMGVIIPVLRSDGETKADIRVEPGRIQVSCYGSNLQWEMTAPGGKLPLTMDEREIASHTGFMSAATGVWQIKPEGAVHWTIRQWQEKLPTPTAK